VETRDLPPSTQSILPSMPTAARITGTFLDEITHDIPSQNWGREDWRKEFELYKRIGIDTAVVIRSGYRNRCIFPSKTIPDLLPVYEDLGKMFLELGEEFGVGLWFGTFDSGHWWMRSTWWKEADLNRAFIDEMAKRYESSPAFNGWYLCHETSRNDGHIIDLLNATGKHCKKAIDKPVLISPFPQGAKQFSGANVMGLDESMDHWERIFSETKGSFDVCAFQDGQIHFQELPAFLECVQSLGKRHGITIWSNLESFDRDVPIKFPPADWRNLRFKLEAAATIAEKIITFEFPHFMSPHSCYPAAHNLFERYAEFCKL
jgi:hypothetical protein